jgi:hypothetical protein
VILWSLTVLVLLVGIWLLVAGLLAALVVAHLSRQQRAQRHATARIEVRTTLASLAQPSRPTAKHNLEWWLAHADALGHELTPALAENPTVRAALEGVANAAVPEVVRLVMGTGVSAASAPARDRSRLHRAATLVSIAPPRSARRALLALQACDDAELGVMASAAMARRPATFTDASAAIACFVGLDPEPPRALAGRWALRRILEADTRRAAVHARDVAPAVQSVALASVDARTLAAQTDQRGEIVALALARTTDASAQVRAAAFTALSRANQLVPPAPVEQGLADAEEIVRTAAAQALPLVDSNRLGLLAALDRADPGVGRTLRRALRTRADGSAPRTEPTVAAARAAWFSGVAAVPTAAAEDAAAHALTDPDAAVRREAALALAAIARAGAPRLQKTTVDALLTRLEAEGSGPVSGAIVEALEAADDERAAGALTALAARAKPTWRLRLTEAAALAQRVRAASERRARHATSGRTPRAGR